MTPAATRMLRAAAPRRLLELDAAGQPTAGHVPPAASSVGLSDRTMWRWLAGSLAWICSANTAQFYAEVSTLHGQEWPGRLILNPQRSAVECC